MKLNHSNKTEMVKRLNDIETLGLTPEQYKIRRLQTKLWFVTKEKRELQESANMFERIVSYIKSFKKEEPRFIHKPEYN